MLITRPFLFIKLKFNQHRLLKFFKRFYWILKIADFSTLMLKFFNVEMLKILIPHPWSLIEFCKSTYPNSWVWLPTNFLVPLPCSIIGFCMPTHPNGWVWLLTIVGGQQSIRDFQGTPWNFFRPFVKWQKDSLHGLSARKIKVIKKHLFEILYYQPNNSSRYYIIGVPWSSRPTGIPLNLIVLNPTVLLFKQSISL